MFSIAGKVAFVAGGTSGIGLAVSQRFAAENAVVVAGGRRPVSDENGVSFVGLDVSDEVSVAETLARVEAQYGRIDILINNAGMENVGLVLEEQPVSDLDDAVATNVRGVLLGLKYGPRHMNDGGAIINTASLAAALSLPTYGIYAATKAAVTSLTRTSALELANRGIRVNAVCPGSIRTAMLPDDHPEVRITTAVCPLARIGETQDVVGVYQFLASSAASYLTGQSIIVDGGVSAGFGYGLLQLVENARAGEMPQN